MAARSGSSPLLIILAKSAADIFVAEKVTMRANKAVLRTKWKSNDRVYNCLVRPKPYDATVNSFKFLLKRKHSLANPKQQRTACSLHRAIQILLPDSELPANFRHWLLEPKNTSLL